DRAAGRDPPWVRARSNGGLMPATGAAAGRRVKTRPTAFRSPGTAAAARRVGSRAAACALHGRGRWRRRRCRCAARRSRSSATGAGGAARRWRGPARSTAAGRRNRRGMSWLLSVDADAVRVAELVRAGDDDAVAFLEAGQDFHLAQGAGTGLDRAARGAAAFDHPGDAATVLLQEGAALDHQHVLAGIE